MMSGLKWYEMEMTFVRGLLPQSVMPVDDRKTTREQASVLVSVYRGIYLGC